jgi:hypothetical protein
MNGKEAKQESGLPTKEGKKASKSQPSLSPEELEAIEHVQDMLSEGDPLSMGAIVARCQQPGAYEYPGMIEIDGRLLARAAKAGHFMRDGELLTPRRLDVDAPPEPGCFFAVGHAPARSGAAAVARSRPLMTFREVELARTEYLAAKRCAVLGRSW